MQHASDRVEVLPSGGALGAEIRGLDLRLALEDATVAQIRRALLDDCVLVFRDQAIGEEDQVRFTGYFGTPVEHVRRQPDRPVKEIFLISNIEENGQPIGALGHGELSFHSDLSYLRRPGTAVPALRGRGPRQRRQHPTGATATRRTRRSTTASRRGCTASAPSTATRSRTRTHPSRWTILSCAPIRRPAAAPCTSDRT